MELSIISTKMPQRIKKFGKKSIFLTSVIFLLLGIVMFGILRYLHQLSTLGVAYSLAIFSSY